MFTILTCAVSSDQVGSRCTSCQPDHRGGTVLYLEEDGQGAAGSPSFPTAGPRSIAQGGHFPPVIFNEGSEY